MIKTYKKNKSSYSQKSHIGLGLQMDPYGSKILFSFTNGSYKGFNAFGESKGKRKRVRKGYS
jgi:hypothetical protein